MSLRMVAFVSMVAGAMLAGQGTALGAVVDQIQSSPGGTSWERAASWSDDNPAGPGNEYHITGFYLRTPDNVSNPTFPGDSLTIHGTGTLALKHNGTVTVNDLHLDGGTISSWVGNRTMAVGGNLAVDADSTFQMNGTNRRDIRLTSTLTGSGNLNLKGSASYAVFRFQADPAAYTGALVVESTLDRLHVEDTFGSSVTVKGTGSGLNWSSFQEFDVAVNGRSATVVSPSGQPVDLGDGTGSLSVARRWSPSEEDTRGLLDLSGASSVTINVGDVRLGTISNVSQEGDMEGILTLSLAGANTLTATNITVGDSPWRGNTDFTSEINLGGAANTINANTMIIGRRKSHGLVDIAAGGSLTMRDKAGSGRADLYIGRNDVSTGANVVGTMDLSGGTNFDGLFDVLAVGVKGSTSHNGKVRGILTLAQANTIDANSIIIGQSGNTGATGSGDQSRLHLGGGLNTILTPSLLVGDRKTTGLIDFATPGGTLNLGTSAARTEITLGRKSVSTGANPVGTMDLRDGTANIFASSIVLGQETNTGNSGAPSGTLWLGDGSLDVSGNIHENHASGGEGSSTLNVVGNQTFTIGGVIDVDNFRVGYNAMDGSVTAAAGSPFNVGDGNGNFDIGRRATASTSDTHGTVDLSSAALVTIDVSNLRLGTITNVSQEGDMEGILTLSQAGANTITATNITVGESPWRGNTDFTSEINLGGAANAVNVDTMIVGGRKSKGLVDIAAGGSLIVRDKAGSGRADLYIARNNANTGSKVVGTVDLSGGVTFDALFGVLAVGDKGNTQNGKAQGTLTLAQTNTIDANSIVVGRSGNSGADTAGDQSRLHLGGGLNTILTPSLMVGDRKTTGLIDFATPGGTLNLGTASARTEITLGRKSVGTGNNAAGTMDLRDGTANIFASSIVLGQETNTGNSGAPSGTLWLGDGSLDVSGNIHENHASGGEGSSTLNVVGNQTFTIGGVIDVDNFRVGYNADNGSVSYAAGSTARIGRGSGNLDVGLRTAALTGTPATVGLLDLSDTQGVEINVTNLRVGNILGSPSGEGSAGGALILSQQAGATNSIEAASIIVGDSPARGNGADNSIQLGPGANSINTNTLVLGGQKSRGRITIAAGGTLTLEGRTPGTPVDVDLGFNVTGSTGTNSVGTLDMTGGTLNATIDQMRLGRHRTGSGSGTGTFTFEAGSVTANSILLGTDNGNSTGTVNFSGGTLTAGSIASGGGTANFEFTGGTLHVDTFGTSAIPFDLEQQGGTLAPGDGPGTTTVLGGYDQTAGIFEVQISGLDQGVTPGYDFVDTSGDALLDGSVQPWVIDGFDPTLGDTFDVLTASSVTLGTNFTLDQSQLDPRHAYFSARVIPGGNGQILRLTVVPEPSALLLALFGGSGILVVGLRRRRATGRR